MDNILLSDQYAQTSVSRDAGSANSAPKIDTALQHAQLNELAVNTESNLGVTLTEVPVMGLLVLRARDASDVLQTALNSAVDLKLPKRLSSEESDTACVRWMSPDEWLLSCPLEQAFAMEKKLNDSVGQASVAITNVSGGYCILNLAGRHAQDVLQKSTPYDVHPTSFGHGKVVNTVFAKAQVCLRCIETDSYELLIRRSFADYVWHWLQVASVEYGLSIEVSQ